MSDSCASCSGDSCSYTSSTSSADHSSIDYSSSTTSSVYTDINNSGGLDAAIDLYGIKDIAEQIYLDNSSNPEKIADSFKDTDMYGVDNLPYGVVGKIESIMGYDSTGEMNINSDIFYDINLSADDMLYTAIHELAHREQLEYSTNMLNSFKEGDSELTADYMMKDYMNQLDDLYAGRLNTSDPTYERCEGLVKNIYHALGDGNIESGQDLFYDALETYGGDFFKALDSFESDLKDNGMNLANVYDALNMLDRELDAKAYDLDTTSQPTSNPNPFAGIYTDTITQGPFGTVAIGMPPLDKSSPFDGIYNFPLADPLSSNKTNIWDLLKEQEEVRERYLQNLYN